MNSNNKRGYGYFFRPKKDFCEWCSFLWLYKQESNSCIICENYDKNEDFIAKEKFQNCCPNYIPHIGYFINTIEAVSSLYQNESSAGGLCTWLLRTLLEENHVDYVLAVGFSPEQQKFQYIKIDKIDDLVRCQRSAYFPIDLFSALEIIREEPWKCAITCIPSVAKALELIKMTDSVFQKKIKYLIWLTYHSTKTQLYTDYLCRKSGKIDGFNKCDYISYRDKPKNTYLGDFVVRSGPKEWRIPSASKPIDWSIGLLQDFSSNFVDDHFSECADITIMDAWHPNYRDTNGVSLAVVRNKDLDSLIYQSSKIHSKKIDPNIILYSQKHGIHFKTKWLQVRLAFFKLWQSHIPTKRVSPSFLLHQPLVGLVEMMRLYLSIYSWKSYILLHTNLVKFEKRLKHRVLIYEFFYRLLSFSQNPLLVLRKNLKLFFTAVLKKWK